MYLTVSIGSAANAVGAVAEARVSRRAACISCLLPRPSSLVLSTCRYNSLDVPCKMFTGRAWFRRGSTWGACDVCAAAATDRLLAGKGASIGRDEVPLLQALQPRRLVTNIGAMWTAGPAQGEIDQRSGWQGR